MENTWEIFDNLQNSIFEIRQLIQSDPEIRKMLLFDTRDALEKTTPSFEEADEFIILSPIFDITEPPFDKNTIMTISVTRSNYNDELVTLNNIIKINILTRSELWELNNNKIRPLEIANKIIQKINNLKISASHKLYFLNIELAILNENVSGYALIFHLEEGSGLDEQF